MKYIREKKVRFGSSFLDVDIYELDDEYKAPESKSSRKRITPPHIIAANDRHSKNHLRQLIVHNFSAGDYYLTPTYSGTPPALDEAQRYLSNFITRLKRLYEKHGVELRAIYVTEGGRPKPESEGGGFTRVHHHIVMNGGVPREDIEKCWVGKQKKGAPTKRGFCNCDMIHTGEEERGCERIAEYIAKSRTKTLGKGLHRWNATRNIKRPQETVIDNKFSRKQTNEIGELVRAQKAVREEKHEQLRRILEKRYGREIIDLITTVNPVTGRVYISARFKNSSKRTE